MECAYQENECIMHCSYICVTHKFRYLVITSLPIVHFATCTGVSMPTQKKKKRVGGNCTIHLSLKSSEKAQKSSQ